MRSADRVLTRTAGLRVCRVRKPDEVPHPEPRLLDVAILDMHHGWPNLGHDSLVRIVGEITRDIQPLLETAGFHVRVISFDIRAGLVLPAPPGDQFLLYIGTGGPGHLDPRLNDGVAPWAQGIRENPAWESPLFSLFDAILGNPDAALIGVCHTFGLLARWMGIARPVLRGTEKGGKSSGIKDNVLTTEAVQHPWFGRFSTCLPDDRRFRILDSRLFDLVPVPGGLAPDTIPISHEGFLPEGNENDALTGVEYARDRGGVMPRILAVNHHPEIRDRRRQMLLLTDILQRGEVTLEWYEERVRILDEVVLSPQAEWNLMQTSQYTLIAPLRFHLYRLARLRAGQLGYPSDLHEAQVLRLPSATLDRAEEACF